MSSLSIQPTAIALVARRDPPAVVRRRRLLIAGGLIGATILPMILCAPILGPWIELTPDSFQYLPVARSLGQTGHLPAVRFAFPPGVPLIFAPLMMSSDLPLIGLRLLLALCWTATGALTYVLHRRLLGEVWALPVAALTALSPVLLTQSTTLLSEPIFIPLSLLALIVLTRWRGEGPRGWTDVVVGGLAIAAAGMVRTIGWVFTPIAMLTLWRESRRQRLTVRVGRVAVLAAVSLAPAVAWQVRQSHSPARHGYIDSIVSPRAAVGETQTGPALVVERLLRFGPQRLDDLKAALVPHRLGWPLFALPAAPIAAWIVGLSLCLIAAGRLVRFQQPTDAYFVVTMAILAVWPWFEGQRLTAPLAPICFGYVAWALRGVWNLRSRRPTRIALRRWSVLAALALLICTQAIESAIAVSTLRARAPIVQSRTADMIRLGAWLRANAPNDAALCGLAPKSSTAKLTLLGAAYFARMPVQINEAPSQPDTAIALPPAGAALVHETLVRRVMRDWNVVPGERFGEFVMVRTGMEP